VQVSALVQALGRSFGGKQLTTPQPGAKVPAQVPTLPGAVGGVADRRLVQLLQSNLPVLKCSRLHEAKMSELTSLASAIEGMVMQLGAPATETLLPVQRQIKRAVAEILISSDSETGLSGAELDAFLVRVERGNATAEDRRSPIFRAAVARATSVDCEVFDYLTSLAVEDSHLASILKISKDLTPRQEEVPGLMHPTFLQARSYAPTNRPLDEDALVSRDMGFDSKPIAGKGKLGARATLATYQAEH